MIDKLRKMRRLTPSDLLALGHLTSVLVAIEIGLHTLPLDRLAAALGLTMSKSAVQPQASGSPPVIDRRTEHRLALAQGLLRRSPVPATCLRRCLVVGHILRRRRPILRVGVAKANGSVTAHAWLEIDGFNLDPTGSADFRPLALDDRQEVR